jgi:hypothetical protein
VGQAHRAVGQQGLEARTLVRRTKSILVIVEDKSEPRIVESILGSTGDKLTEQEAHLVYEFLTGVSASAKAGGDGSSPETAVVITASSSPAGIAQEYSYLERVCGERGVAWKLAKQMLISQDRREYDCLCIEMSDGSRRDYWFDITSFYGKR